MPDLTPTQLEALRACPDADSGLVAYPESADEESAAEGLYLLGLVQIGRQNWRPPRRGYQRTPAGKALVEAKERESDG